MRLLNWLAAWLVLAAAPAVAQLRVDITEGLARPMPIAVPGFGTPVAAPTAAGPTDALGRQVAQVIAANLSGTGLFAPLADTAQIAYPQALAPDHARWRGQAAQALVTGFVQVQGDGSITVGCYLYDPFAEAELLREGFVVEAGQWRRAAHRCADRVYTRLTGEAGYFDSQIVYVSETGPAARRIKRLAIMDQDGAGHRFLTNGQTLVLTPRFAPGQGRIAYVRLADEQAQIWTYDVASGRHSPLGDFPGMTLGPRFSPDGRALLLSMSRAGNIDIYRYDLSSRALTRLTDAPGIDTAPSWSPDGRQIVFESDRSGGQQLYVMNADGSGLRRISFGSGRYAEPAWSPRGDLIAFTRIGGGQLRVGVMRPDGSAERMLTDSWQDEGPSWSPNGRVLVFFRTPRGGGGPRLASVDLTGRNLRPLATPLGASDPSWGPLRP